MNWFTSPNFVQLLRRRGLPHLSDISQNPGSYNVNVTGLHRNASGIPQLTTVRFSSITGPKSSKFVLRSKIFTFSDFLGKHT